MYVLQVPATELVVQLHMYIANKDVLNLLNCIYMSQRVQRYIYEMQNPVKPVPLAGRIVATLGFVWIL